MNNLDSDEVILLSIRFSVVQNTSLKIKTRNRQLEPSSWICMWAGFLKYLKRVSKKPWYTSLLHINKTDDYKSKFTAPNTPIERNINDREHPVLFILYIHDFPIPCKRKAKQEFYGDDTTYYASLFCLQPIVNRF